jgi:multiple sugar transport system permease protein
LYSLYVQDIYGNSHWAGVSNYLRFFQDPFMARIVSNTLFYMTVVPLIDIALAIPLAVILKRLGSLGKKILPLIMIPSFIPGVTAAMMWYLMLNPFFGLAYYLFPYNWASSIWTVVIVDVWRTLPLTTLIIYSGLISIPREVEEAAQADGLAGPRKLFQIDLPLVAPQILTAAVLMMISGFFTFDPIYIGKSQAGPRALDNLAFYAFEQFYEGVPGYASAIIVLMGLLATAMAMVYIRLLSTSSFIKIPVPRIVPSSETPLWIQVAILLIYMTFIVLPIAWLILLSLKSPKEILSVPPTILPIEPSLSNYYQAFSQGLPYMAASLIAALTSTGVTIALAAPAAYVMSRHGLGGSRLLAYILFLNATPTIIYIVPLFLILRSLGVLNNVWGLVAVFPIMTCPIVSWILYNYYKRFPAHIEEAAQTDGMNRLRAFARIVLPLSREGLLVAFIYSFLIAWGALIFPLAFTYSPYDLSKPLSFSGAQTFSIFIGILTSPATVSYGVTAAAGVISSIPPIILLLLGRNSLEKIWASGGYKG